MEFGIEDMRKKPAVKIGSLIKKGVISLEDVLDWLMTIHEIRFFEEKVFELLGQNVIKVASHL